MTTKIRIVNLIWVRMSEVGSFGEDDLTPPHTPPPPPSLSHITMAQYQQFMNLLSKSSGPCGASSETTLTRANLTHSNPNQIHNSGFGSHFFSIPTTHTPNTLSSHTAPWLIDSRVTDHITCSLDYFYTYSTIVHFPMSYYFF